MSILNLLFDVLVENPRSHIPTCASYNLCKSVARVELDRLFSSPERIPRDFGRFGTFSFPFTRMGNVSSLDIFSLDELILFSFYHVNRKLYRRVLDIGANLGLHSLIMSRSGFEVRAFEPDPWHYEKLTANLEANAAASVTPVQAAVSTTDGEAKFVRVLGNTTASHLAGARDSYGDREYFNVHTCAVQPLFTWADLAKIDAEGHEKDLLLSATRETMNGLDILVEIGSKSNATAVFDHFEQLGVGMFAQKIGWERAQTSAALPTSYREGSLFISMKPAMPWRYVSCRASSFRRLATAPLR